MNWQLTIVLFLVSFSACYLVRRAWLTWRGTGKGCGQGCGCGPEKEKSTADLLQLDNVRLTRGRRL